MGRRYSKEDLEQIKALVNEGLTNMEISNKLGRSEAGIRNIRYRLKLEADTRETLQSLLQEKDMLSKEIASLNRTRSTLSSEISSQQGRREKISGLLSLDEDALNDRLIKALTRLKDQKPELFYISGEEQIGKLAGQLTVTFIKWLFS